MRKRNHERRAGGSAVREGRLTALTKETSWAKDREIRPVAGFKPA